MAKGERDPVELYRARAHRLARRDIAIHPPDPGAADDTFFYRPGELVVVASALERVERELKRQKVHVQSTAASRGTSGVVALRVRGARDVPAIVDELEESLGDEGLVSPNHVLAAAPSHTLGPATEPEEIKAVSWAPCDDDRGRCVRVAVVDTGIVADPSAPWLAQGVRADADDVEDPFDGAGLIEFPAGHGTFVAGVVRRHAPGATVLVEQVLEDHLFVDEFDLANQLDQALAGDPDIVNLSLGGYTRRNRPPLGLAPVWERMRARTPEVVVIGAAGNDGSDAPFWPAASPEVIGVGALAADGRTRAWFSNFGEWVDVWAPGDGQDNAFVAGRYQPNGGLPERRFDGYARWSGTSFAAPVVAGVIAARMTAEGVDGATARDHVLAETVQIAGVGPALPL